MKYLKRFEDVQLETQEDGKIDPGIPGFETGGYDPEDSDETEIVKQIYKATYERNFIDKGDFIEVNMNRLYDDFYNHIYNCDKYYKIFLRDKLVGKYVCAGIVNIMEDDEKPEGIIDQVGFQMYTDDDRYHRMLVTPKFKGQPRNDDLLMQEKITIDKIKSNSEKFGI